MAAGDLATLADVKAWLSIAPADTTQDAVLSRLITSISGRVRSYLNRYSLISQTYIDRFDGNGNSGIVLRNWPVTSVSSVSVGSLVVPKAAIFNPSTPGVYGGQAGWSLTEYDGNPPGSHQLIELCGHCFEYGSQNVAIQYTAGYLADPEEYIITGTLFQYQVLALQGPWSADNGVMNMATGEMLTPVTGTPSSGQYQVASPGLYQFAAADVGITVVIMYSFTPADLEQVVIEWVGERNAYRSRIGQRSKSLGGQETMSFDLSSIPSYVAAALAPYTDVVPLPP